MADRLRDASRDRQLARGIGIFKRVAPGASIANLRSGLDGVSDSFQQAAYP